MGAEQYTAEFAVRMDLAKRALSIGYTKEGAGRLMDEAFYMDEAPHGDECPRHPAMRTVYITDPSKGECEACEVIRQSDAAGYVAEVAESNLKEAVAEAKAAKSAKPVTLHYLEAGYHSNACGRNGAGDADPRKTTCGGCKRTSRHAKAAYLALRVDAQEAFGNAGIREGMLVRHRESGVLGVIRTIDTRCNVGYWGNPAGGVRGADHYAFPTPEVLMGRCELITIDDLITVGSTVEYVGRTYTVTRVSMAEGVSLREVGTWRSGREVTAAEFAADLGNGYLKITELAPSGAETDPIITMINTAEAQAKRDLMATFAEGTHILVRDNSRIVLARITGMGESQVTWMRVDDFTRVRSVTFAQFQGYVSSGVITATTVATTKAGDVIYIDLTPVDQDRYTSLSAVSMEAFRLSGAGLHNRNHDHEIRAYYGMCCDNVAVKHYHLAVVPTVIAAWGGQSRTRLDALVGDVMLIDGRPWRIVAQRAADPILVPCQFEQ